MRGTHTETERDRKRERKEGERRAGGIVERPKTWV